MNILESDDVRLRHSYFNDVRYFDVLSLGGGIQSTTILYLSQLGIIPRLNFAVFADTGWERKETIRHIKFLRRWSDIPILVGRVGNIRDDITFGIKEQKSRMDNPPFFTKNVDTGKMGMVRRECTKYYKVAVVKRTQKQYIRKHLQQDGTIHIRQWFGISQDERSRKTDSIVQYIINKFPLLDLKWTRQDCIMWMKKNKLPVPVKSACIGCPFRSDAAWLELNNEERKDAIEVDRTIRKGGFHFTDQLYLHRSGKPLSVVLKILDAKQLVENEESISDECTGNCWT